MGLQKKTVSKLYSSLYSSDQQREKVSNSNIRDEYDKVYQEFLKSKRNQEHEFVDSQRDSSKLQIFHRNHHESGSENIINGSSKKWYTKRKSGPAASRLVNLGKSKKRPTVNFSRSKDRKNESRVDFYKRKGFEYANDLSPDKYNDKLTGHKTYDDHDKENQNRGDNLLISDSERNKTIKMFRISTEEYDDNSSSTPEASNEHKEADIDIEGHMDQRMISVNKMGFTSKWEVEEENQAEYIKSKNGPPYYRSRSENNGDEFSSRNHPKSQVSSPNEVSSSTIKNTSTIPTTIQSDTVCVTSNRKETLTSVQNRTKGVKHYCKKSSIEKTSDSNE